MELVYVTTITGINSLAVSHLTLGTINYVGICKASMSRCSSRALSMEIWERDSEVSIDVL